MGPHLKVNAVWGALAWKYLGTPFLIGQLMDVYNNCLQNIIILKPLNFNI